MNTQSNTYNPEKFPSYVVHLLGRRITPMTIPAVIDVIDTACTRKSKLVIASYNIHSFNLSMQLPWFYDFLQTANLARCDGVGILKTLKYMGLDLPRNYQVSGTYLVPTLLEHFQDHELSFFLLGSKPKNIEAALSRLREQYPNSKFSGHHGYFDKNLPQENEKVIEMINAVRPNILIIGMGMPVQEKWIWQHSERLNVNVILPCGAVIDRLAGVVSNCPKFVSELGLEWLYRLLREPKRLAARYLLGNPAFLLQVALGKCHQSSLNVERIHHLSVLQEKLTVELENSSSRANVDEAHEVYDRLKTISS